MDGSSTPSGSQAPQEEGPTVAVVDGSEITLGELDAWIRDQLFRQEVAGKNPSEQFEIRSEALEAMITEKLIAARASSLGIEPEEVISQAQAAFGPVTEEEVAEFFGRNHERFPAADTLERRAPQIRAFLEHERRKQALAALRSEVEVRVEIQPPRIEVAASGPSLGPDDAPVTIVEFSDFQCPFCGRVEPTVREVLERYPEQVRLVFRHFPLDSIHPRARAAAVASVCAADQGHFWQYHERLFANQRALGDRDLIRYAGELDLDLENFRACTQADEARATVQGDLEAGQAAGVSGTPAFFVNGILLSGAKPVVSFAELIDRELEQRATADES